MTIAPEGTATDRLVDKLAAAARGEDVTFSPAQVAYLMGAAGQWARDVIDGEPSKLSFRAGYDAGYRARVAEENAAYPPEPFHVTTTAGQDAVAVYRSRSGVDHVTARPGDFQGLGIEAVEALRQESTGGSDQVEDPDGSDRRGEDGRGRDPGHPA